MLDAKKEGVLDKKQAVPPFLVWVKVARHMQPSQAQELRLFAG